MSTDTIGTTSAETVQIRAHGAVLKQSALSGEPRSAAVRSNRGGVASLPARSNAEYAAGALRARRQRHFPTTDEPSR